MECGSDPLTISLARYMPIIYAYITHYNSECCGDCMDGIGKLESLPKGDRSKAASGHLLLILACTCNILQSLCGRLGRPRQEKLSQCCQRAAHSFFPSYSRVKQRKLKERSRSPALKPCSRIQDRDTHPRMILFRRACVHVQTYSSQSTQHSC